ncbi:DNA-3-methyladenine glycosylase I [Streptococcus sp. X16XC17]|uniref:DNA-3-methyladenine glycosylase I n=1 Tax=unclassified Streptococcus TaxID=2608887 RepID=UPI00066FDB3E|nr:MULTISPECIES: DNA-3-methyladenine glycosylase I [unclassified Streptococcus]TCD45425.1 DNA-3-methyladenine glycosylase I [Streptococcus sp. X16XC17]
MKRCAWTDNYKPNPLMTAYHDKEWGKPLHDDQSLFELLSLEMFQAGLSWETVLNKRAAFQLAFHDFDIITVAQMTDEQLEALLQNPAIIRNRMKVYACRTNAQEILKIQAAFGSFDTYIWSFADGKTIDHQIIDPSQIPAQNQLSQHISKVMKKRGFKFIGPTIIYSYLQAAGLINDHEVACEFRI